MSIYIWNKEIKSLFAWEPTEKDCSAMRWPAPEWFHIPLMSEWQWLKTIMDSLSLTTWDNWRVNLHIPLAGNRNYDTAEAVRHDVNAYLWSSSPNGEYARYFGFNAVYVFADGTFTRAQWDSLRCFKDSFEEPTSSRTVIQWTLWWAWIFRNKTDWLISITSDWTTWYTIQDKNLWATVVYNKWDTLSEANCGKYYQWWNNYWFARTWSITTSSTKVNAQNYWPWNYYSSSTFITVSGNDRSSVRNDNLRWWVTWIKTKQVEAKAVYLWDAKVRPALPKYRTFTISRTEKNNMSSGWTYSDDAAWLTAWDPAFDEFFWYYWVRLTNAWFESAKVKQSSPWVLDITQLWTLTSGDNVMIAFPKMWYKMSKSWSTVTLSLTTDPDKASEWYKYYAFTKWTEVKDTLYLWAYEMTENYNSLSWKAPLANQTRSAFRSWVQNKYWASSWYSIMTYRPRDFIKMLYMMKYGNPNSQTVIWKWLTSWNSTANTWATNSITNATWATNTSNTWRIKLYWLEDIWWNVSEWMDWCYFNSSKHLTVDNTNSVFQDSAYSTDLWVASSWYMMTIDWSTDWTFKNTSSSAASSSTYYCDGFYANADRVLHAGGYYTSVDNAGIFFVSTLAATTAYTFIGSRLQFL